MEDGRCSGRSSSPSSNEWIEIRTTTMWMIRYIRNTGNSLFLYSLPFLFHVRYFCFLPSLLNLLEGQVIQFSPKNVITPRSLDSCVVVCFISIFFLLVLQEEYHLLPQCHQLVDDIRQETVLIIDVVQE